MAVRKLKIRVWVSSSAAKRFEAAFGVVPGLLAAAICYSLYHVGYGMEPAEMLFLFGDGLTFGAMFRLTRNILVLWPFYTPVGSFYSNVKSGLALPFEASMSRAPCRIPIGTDCTWARILLSA